MDSRTKRSESVRLVLQTVGLAAAFFCAARLGQLVAISPGNVTPVWPPSGIAVAAFLLLGRRATPGIVLGALLAGICAFFWKGPPAVMLAVGGVISAGSTLQAVVGAYALRRLTGGALLDRPATAFRFTVIAAAMCLVSSTVGTAALWGGGLIPGSAFRVTWTTWWLGDLLGVLVVTPVAMSWADRRAAPWSWRGAVSEWVPLLAALLAVTWLVFSLPEGAAIGEPYWLFPLLGWAAVRFGTRGATTAMLVVSAAAVTATAAGRGPFATTDGPALMRLQEFLGMTQVAVLVLAAVVAQHQAVLGDLVRSRQTFELAVQAANDAIWDWNLETNAVWLSPERFAALFGYPPHEVEQSFEFWLERVHPDDRAAVQAGIDAALADRENIWTDRYRFRRQDGRYAEVMDRGFIVRDENGRPLRMVGAMKDLTAHIQLEEQYRAVFESATDGISICNLDGVLVEVNPALCRICGYAREAMVGRTPLEFIPPDRHHDFLSAMGGLMAGQAVHGESVTRRTDGTRVPLEFTGRMFQYRGAPHALFMLRDVTARHQAELALRASEARFRVLAEASPTGIFLTDPRGASIYCNPRAAVIVGLTPDECLGDGWARHVHPDDRDWVGVEFEAAMAAGRGITFDLRYLLPTGAVRWTHTVTAPTPDGGFVGIIEDVTEQRQAEAERERQGRRLAFTSQVSRALAETDDPVAAARACAAAAVEHLGAAFARVWTLDDGAEMLVLRASAGMYTHLNGPDGRVPVGQYKIGLIAQEKTPHLTNDVVGNPGVADQDWAKREGMVAFAGYPLVVAGKVYGVLAMFARAALAPDTLTVLAEAADRLAHWLARKQAEARQAELVRQLQAANAELNDFAYVVSHDLKAPLRAIGSLASWIADDHGERLGPDGKEQLGLLLGRVHRLNGLIDGILQYSRVGRAPERSADTDLNAVVAGVIDLLAPPPHVTVAVPRPLPTVRCDPVQVGQVFQNLIGNAVKFLDKPAGRVTVEWAAEDGHWRFAVSDNGPGIEARHFAKVFQIFQTLRPRDEVESSGVGLAIVKKAVERWGGQVGVESVVGQGTTFWFTLPREPSPGDP